MSYNFFDTLETTLLPKLLVFDANLICISDYGTLTIKITANKCKLLKGTNIFKFTRSNKYGYFP